MTMRDPLSPLIAALKHSGAASSDFDLSSGVTLPENRRLRPAGVLVAILCDGDEARLFLTKRSSVLRHHPGQIAFPGGKPEPQDSDIIATALREASEEIGLEPGNVEVLGCMPLHETVTGFNVTPVLARVRAPFSPRPESGEVEEVFQVPLDHVLDVSRYSVQARRWRGTLRHYYTVPYGPYYIWGATARMLHALAESTGPA